MFWRAVSEHSLSWALVLMGDSPKVRPDDGEDERVIEK